MGPKDVQNIDKDRTSPILVETPKLVTWHVPGGLHSPGELESFSKFGWKTMIPLHNIHEILNKLHVVMNPCCHFLASFKKFGGRTVSPLHI